MSDVQHRAAVQAHYLLAASNFQLTGQGRPDLEGVAVTPHPATAGVLLSATTGAQMAVIYDGHGAIAGEPRTWRIPNAIIAREMKKARARPERYYGDLWVVMTWSGAGTVELVQADSGAEALAGLGKKVKTIFTDAEDLIVTNATMDVLGLIQGATASERELAPNHWFYSNGMVRLGQCAEDLARGGPPIPIALLRTDRSNIVQVAFRGCDEATVYLATTRESGSMRTDNPAWLNVLL